MRRRRSGGGLAAGHLAGAMAAYERLRRTSETYPTPGFRAWADQAQGAVLIAGGDPTAALAPLQAAATAYHRMQVPYDAACVELLLAQAHRQRGDEGKAETHGDAAAALFVRLGASAPPRAQAYPPLPAGLTGWEAEPNRSVVAATRRDKLAEQSDDDPGNYHADNLHDSPFSSGR